MSSSAEFNKLKFENQRTFLFSYVNVDSSKCYT